MQTINKNSAGMALGLLIGLGHLCWTILVALGWAKPLLDFIMNLHFVQMQYSLAPFDFVTALFLVLLTFVVGFVVGWIFAALWNALAK